MERWINKPPLIKRTINQQYIKPTMIITCLNDSRQNSSAVKKENVIIGDWMIKYVNGREFSRNDSVKVKVILEQQQMTSLNMSDPLFEKT